MLTLLFPAIVCLAFFIFALDLAYAASRTRKAKALHLRGSVPMRRSRSTRAQAELDTLERIDRR